MALSADKTTSVGRQEGRTAALLIANAVTVYRGGLICADSSGFANPAAQTAGFHFMGVCIRHDGTVLGAGCTGDGATKYCVVERRGTNYVGKVSAAQSDIGKLAYVVDDATVTTTAPTANAFVVGQVVGVPDSADVEVDLEIKSL